MTADLGGFREFEAAGWEEAASAYSESRVVDDLMRRAALVLTDAVHAAPGRRILDVACGPGLASQEALHRGATVVGVDLAEAMVVVAERNAPQAEFRRASGEQLPFEDETFDGVMCGFGLPHFADPEAAFSEALRVLVDGGRIAFTTWCAPEKVPFFGIVFTAVVEHGTLDVALPEGPDMFRFAAEDEVLRILGAMGFVDVATIELPLTVELEEASEAMELVSSATVRTRALFEAQTPSAQRAIAQAVDDEVDAMRIGGRLVVPMPAVLISASRP